MFGNIQKFDWDYLLSFLWITFGALLASFAVACILLPNQAIDYGTAGIGILVSKLTSANLSLMVIVFFLPFLFASWFFLGRQFFFRSLVGSIVYTLGLSFFEGISFQLNTEHFIAVAFGGAILGAGLSVILCAGGTIDGSEILANIITEQMSKRTGRNYSLTFVLLIFNSLVYLAVFFLLSQEAALLSLLVYIVATTVVDRYTDHFESIKQVTIITKEPEPLIQLIRQELNKTVTKIQSEGSIAGDNVTLVCYMNYFELQKMRTVIEKTDNHPFITVSTVDEILWHSV